MDTASLVVAECAAGEQLLVLESHVVCSARAPPSMLSAHTAEPSRRAGGHLSRQPTQRSTSLASQDPERGVEHVRCERGWISTSISSPQLVALGAREVHLWDVGGGQFAVQPPPTITDASAPSGLSARQRASTQDEANTNLARQEVAASTIQSYWRSRKGIPYLSRPISFQEFLALVETDAIWQQATGLGAPP